MKDNPDIAYQKDIIHLLKKIVRMMPDEIPEDKWEFQMQVLVAESQILKLKGELGI